jgi:hypothetical protein
MPNWCNNQLTLTHSDPAQIDRAVTAFEQGRFLEEFIPVPQELRDTHASPGTSEEALVTQRNANVAKYGYADWWMFCVNEWGTKWDVGGENEYVESLEPTQAEFTFDSAWAPPLRAYERLTELGFTVEAYYFEPGLTFTGSWTSEAGDDYWEYGDMTPDEIREEMPELDERFCISDMLEEWAEENQEIELNSGIDCINE